MDDFQGILLARRHLLLLIVELGFSVIIVLNACVVSYIVNDPI